MRWIFISLVVVNIVTVAYGLVFGSRSTSENRVQTSGSPLASSPQLVLLSELEAGDLRPVTPAPADNSDVALPVGATDNPFCELVGPFERQQTALDFIERLRAIDIQSELMDLELPSGPGYRVYLAPSDNRREAMRRLSELQEKQIDSYVIPKGALANGISLGMFSRKALSDARVQEMQAIGLEPLVEEIERTYRETWVMLLAGEGAKMSEITWGRVMEGINMLERRQNYCLDVASQ